MLISLIRRFALLVLLGAPLQLGAEQAIGIITDPAGARIVRHDSATDLAAVGGELLFAGDTIRIPNGASAPVGFTVCAGDAPSLGYKLSSGSVALRAGKVEGDAAAPARGDPCQLPDVPTDPALGMLVERSLDTGVEAIKPTPADFAKISAADRAKLTALDGRISQNPKDVTARASRASLLQHYGLDTAAENEYMAIANGWEDQQWARTLAYSIATKSAPPNPGTGKLYAAFIGISQYEQPAIRPLKFADSDAILFASFLAKARAQAFSPDRQFIRLLNADAKSSAVRTKLTSFFGQATASDSVLLYIAAHGVGPNDTDDGYVVLYDTHPESTFSNSLSMSWIREFLVSQAARVRHVYVFVDTCHANRIGPIKHFGSADQGVAGAAKLVTGRKVLAMYASGDNESSFENPRYGGGHGAFTYFLLRGLNITKTDPDYAKADSNGDGFLDAGELANYVEDSVRSDTHNRQRPQEDVRIDQFSVSTTLPGLAIAPCCGAVSTGTNVIRDPTQASDDARSITWEPPPQVELRTSLEETSQQILYKYLQGDEVPQTAADFTTGLNATEQARALAGESLYLDARAEFFRGRLLLFSKSYTEALLHLEKAIRMDPASPYPYNALGIGYLEMGRYDEAAAAFRDAISRARNWAYPRHNLALVYLQRGDYRQAVAEYRDAEERMPQYSYLPYNLGLIYQRLNQPDDAEREYRLALKNAPSRAAPLVALGVLAAVRGSRGKALEYYREAHQVLDRNPEREVLLNLRHNEATLYAERKSTLDMARSLWEANIQEADYMPSRFALARAEAHAAASGKAGAYDGALAQYAEIVTKLPGNEGARIEYSDVLVRAGRRAQAMEVLTQGLSLDPHAAALQQALDRLRSAKAPR